MANTKVKTQDLQNDIVTNGEETPGISRYYGTNGTGQKGFHSLPNTYTSRLHFDSGTLIQGNIYPDYQEQTMPNTEKYRSVEIPTGYTTLTVTGVKTVLHDDVAGRGSFVFNIRKNGTSVHTITLPNLTSTLDTTSLSLTWTDADKLSVVVTTADASNTVGAEIFLTYNLS